MDEITMKVPSKELLLVGWAMFVLSIFLPVNISIGGLTDPGQSHFGFINIMYSLFSFVIIFEMFKGRPSDSWRNCCDLTGSRESTMGKDPHADWLFNNAWRGAAAGNSLLGIG
jgi:hypothetical protein